MFDEVFNSGSCLQKSENTRNQALMMFEEVDKDGSGMLDRDEVKLLCQKMGKNLSSKQIDAAMAEMDDDGGGEVDYEEFKKWWADQGGHV